MFPTLLCRASLNILLANRKVTRNPLVVAPHLGFSRKEIPHEGSWLRPFQKLESIEKPPTPASLGAFNALHDLIAYRDGHCCYMEFYQGKRQTVLSPDDFTALPFIVSRNYPTNPDFKISVDTVHYLSTNGNRTRSGIRRIHKSGLLKAARVDVSRVGFNVKVFYTRMHAVHMLQDSGEPFYYNIEGLVSRKT